MADLPPSPNSNSDDSGARQRRGAPPSTPRWVKVFGVVAVALLLLLVILHLTGHSPGGHTSHPDLTQRGAYQP